jgi:PAS domain S-box-containing protein
VYILFRYAFSIKSPKRKRLQAFFIAFGILIPAVQGIITQIIYPVILRIPDVPITSSFLTLFSLATILSMRRFNLFNVSESVDVKTVLANLRNLVMVISPEKEIIYMNPYAEEILAKEKIEEEDASIQTIFASPAHYETFVAEAFTPSLNGTPVTDYATVFCTASGKKIDVLLSVQIVTNNRQVQGLLAVATDVTELSKTLRELEKTNKELERFAFVASHDLQEPLRKISTYLRLLETKYKNEVDEKAKSYISVAVNAGSQMRSLISDLLEYSDIATNTENTGTADMNEVVAKVTTRLALQIEESGAKVETQQLPVLQKANQSQMEQLIQNLLSNALKYRRGENSAQIKIGATELEDRWQFSIKDNGIGIDPEYREQVFVVFQKLHSKGKYAGTGIGLSICKKIVEQHNGKIWIESNEQGGCTFFFTIQKGASSGEAITSAPL